jgi:hypothetical protein
MLLNSVITEFKEEQCPDNDYISKKFKLSIEMQQLKCD